MLEPLTYVESNGERLLTSMKRSKMSSTAKKEGRKRAKVGISENNMEEHGEGIRNGQEEAKTSECCVQNAESGSH